MATRQAVARTHAAGFSYEANRSHRCQRTRVTLLEAVTRFFQVATHGIELSQDLTSAGLVKDVESVCVGLESRQRIALPGALIGSDAYLTVVIHAQAPVPVAFLLRKTARSDVAERGRLTVCWGRYHRSGSFAWDLSFGDRSIRFSTKAL